MKINPLPLLQRMKIWQLWLFSVILSVLLAEAVTTVMGLLLKGEVPPDYLLTGLVASGFVASLVVAMLGYFLEKLTESQLQLHAIIEAEPECVKLLAADGTLLQMNRAGLNMIEADSLDQIVGQRAQQFVTPEYRDAFIALTKRVFEGGSGNLEFELHGFKGSHRWMDTHAVPLRDSHGHITALLAVTRDITERKVSETALLESEARFRTMADSAPVLIWIARPDKLCNYFNKGWLEFTGRTMEQEIGNGWAENVHPEDFQRYLDTYVSSFDARQEFSMEYRLRRFDGEYRWLLDHGVPLYDEQNTFLGYIGSCIDITERKTAEDEIQYLAFYDTLTQLPNRRLLQERLKHGIDVERREGKQLALLMLDLDRFKAVNDSLGHQAGDELLQQVATRITTRLREVDMVARLGGDEFIVLLEDITHPDDAARVAEEIIANLSKPFQLTQSDDVRIGASIGISLYPQHGDNSEILLDHADAALYLAKDQGRGCFAYFSEDLTRTVRERIALEVRLRKAIEQQELRVFYQPQMDIASGRIVGAEALVRWQDPAEGLIPPSRFIPIAEETSLIVEIGEWVLRETCNQGRQWLDMGLPSLTLAVNVSPHQFRRSDINALVATVLRDTGFPAGQLELEITESGLMANQDSATAILNNLRAQGIRLAIDDFGTGYSSLAYLKRFPLDVLKIDKSFIDDIPHNKDDMEIAATIVAMGHALGFKVLAEGVETPEQLAFLQAQDCDLYQGYLKSHPLAADDFVALLQAGDSFQKK